jgi:hypothetical protein
MARTKQLARHSTGGVAPRQDIARKAARISDQHVIVHALASFEKNVFAGYSRGNRHVADVPSSIIHPQVRGFLNLLGPLIRIPVSDLRRLLDDNIEVAPDFSFSTWSSQMTTGEAGFERIRVSFDPSKSGEKERWVISGANKTADNWTRVSALTYTADAGSVSVDFSDYANSDPKENKLWAPVCKDAAKMIWEQYKLCKDKITDAQKDGLCNFESSSELPPGSRPPSTTVVQAAGSSFPVTFSRALYPDLSCVPASLANLLAREERVLADTVATTAPVGISNIHRLGNWVFRDLEPRLYEIIHCLPPELRSISRRDPVNKDVINVNRRSAQRLSWLLSQSARKFLCAILDSEGQSNHVVGVDTELGVIFDHEDTRTLPLNKSGFDSCCGGHNICIGLGEVKELIRSERKDRKRMTQD